MVQMKLYIVRPGDSLFTIARRFGTTVEALAYDNQLADPNRLAVGRALVIEDDTPGGSLGRTEAAGYTYPSISRSTLAETLPFLTYLIPFTYTLDKSGNLTPSGGEDLNSAAYAQNVAPLMSIANLKEEGGFSSDIAHAVLTDQAAQDNLIREIVTAINRYSYYGVVLDLEYVYSFDREAYNQFTRRLANVLHRLGAVIGVALAPKVSADQAGLLYEAHDYRAQGEAADFIYLMTYEWGYMNGPPQAISPVNQVRRVLDYAITEIPPGKIMMGMSNYAYNWTLPWRQGTSAKLISNAYAADLAAARRVEIQYDETAQAPWFQYRDNTGAMHVVWFEDPRSIRARLRLIPEYGLRGIFWWNINQLFRPGYLMYDSLFDTVKVF